MLDAIGATVQLAATVQDRAGRTVSGARVTWTSSAAAVATVSATGLLRAVTEGTAQITATSGALTSILQVTVAPAPVAPVKLAGDAQSGAAGSALPAPLQVKITDRLGGALAGRVVTFAVAQGGGSVGTATVTTGADGVASTVWTLGTAAGAPNAVTATLAGHPAAATFTATAVAGAPAAIAVTAGAGQSAMVGETVPVAPAVRVTDAFANPVPGAAVAFTVATGGGTVAGGSPVTNEAGIAAVTSWTLGTLVGPNSLTVTVGALPGVSVSASATAAPPASLSIAAGNGQSAPAGFPVAIPPTVLVRDRFQNPIPGVTVTFAVASGGGTVAGGVVSTNGVGLASVGGWTLGAAEGANTLSASVTGTGIAGNPVTFTATGTGASSYNIELRFLTGSLSPGQVAAFTSAATRWQSIITQDLSATPINVGSGRCGGNAPSLSETIDDLVIFVTIEPIDGNFGVLGSAGPCFIRNSNSLPLVGQMRFDVADLDRLEQDGRLESVILHEMGHVLGIGTLWGTFGLIVNPSMSNGAGADTHFIGTQALGAFNLIGGATYSGGAKVPVHNTAAAGSADAHWRESVLGNELMTPTINAGTNPLSILSIRSLQDLGYAVSVGTADSFALSLSFMEVPPGGASEWHLVDDVAPGPIYRVDSLGRVIGVIQR